MLDENRVSELARIYRQMESIFPTEKNKVIYRERAVALECILAEPSPTDNKEYMEPEGSANQTS